MKLACLVLIVMSGCSRISNEEIIAKTKQCVDAGLKAEYGRGMRGEITDVQCGPKP